MSTFTKHLKRLFIISLKKSYAKTIVETSRPDICPALYAKLLTYQPTSASVERSFSMLKPMIHENRNFTDAHVAFYYKIVFNS